MTTSTHKSAFCRALERYASALHMLQVDPRPTSTDVLDVLVARDAVQAMLPVQAEEDTAQLARLVELDALLKEEGEDIATTADLAACRAAVNPPPEAWWWEFQPPAKVDVWDRLDWAWNLIALALLAWAAALMKGIYDAFSVGSLTTSETLGTIAQGAGLALIGGGALTEGGRDRIQRILSTFGIPRRFYSEVTCVVAFVLMLGMIAARLWLHTDYMERGKMNYENGHLSAAADDYLKILALNPTDGQARIRLGDVYASLGSHDLALEQYWQGVEDDPYGFNEIGLTYIQRFDPVKKRTDPVLAETFLRMALQRALSQGNDEADRQSEPSWESLKHKQNTLFQIYRNLGWALLNQKRYREAEQHLKAAIHLDENIVKPFCDLPWGGQLENLKDDRQQLDKILGVCMNLNKNDHRVIFQKFHGTQEKIMYDPDSTHERLLIPCQETVENRKHDHMECYVRKENDHVYVETEFRQIGGGMAYCFLAQLYTEQWTSYNNREERDQQQLLKDKANTNWDLCKEKARPETVGEYKWFLDVNQASFANCIDTSSVISGLDDLTKLKDRCALNLPWNADSGPGQAAKATGLSTQLHDRIGQRWAGNPHPYPDDVVYELHVAANGMITGYDPVGKQAKEYAGKTPLPDLVAPVQLFKVVFKPEGAFEVVPEP